jgi:hypothetical protein
VTAIPTSLRRVLDAQKRNAEPPGDKTWIWRDGTVIRERANGKVERWPSIDPVGMQSARKLGR